MGKFTRVEESKSSSPPKESSKVDRGRESAQNMHAGAGYNARQGVFSRRNE